MRKRFLSLFLAVVIVAGLMPGFTMTAVAAESTPTIGALTINKTFTAGDNIAPSALDDSKPTVTANSATITAQGWQVPSGDNWTNWTEGVLPLDTTSTFKLRYYVTYSGGTITSNEVTLNVVGKVTTLTLATSPESPQSTGTAITLTATITGFFAGPGVNGQTITFKKDGTTLGTSALNTVGVATYNWTPDSAGTYSLTAEYAATDYNAAATSNAITWESTAAASDDKAAYASGAAAGTSAVPVTYNISNETQLRALATTVNGGTMYQYTTFVLQNDIVLSGGAWTPIGINTTNAFKGTFDGNGKKITGIKIGSKENPDTSLSYVGLFGIVDGGTIKNIGLNAQIYSNKRNATVGGLTGFSGIIINSYATGTVSGGISSYVGGLAGYSQKVTNSYASVNVNGGDSSYVGRLVGFNNGTIEYSYWNSEAIKTMNWVSQYDNKGVGFGISTGTSGWTSADMKNTSFVTTLNRNLETISDATLHKWAPNIGDFPTLADTLWIPPTKIEKTITIATTAPVKYTAIDNGTSTTPAGASDPVITWSANGGTSWESASGSFAAGKVYKTRYVYTANTGYQFDSTIAQGDILVTNLGSGTKTIELTNRNKTLTITLTWPATVPSGWTGGITTTTDTWDNGGTITTAQELAQFAYNVNNGKDYSGKTITLNNDISLSGDDWTPIGISPNAFKGTFDGNGKKITGIKIGSSSAPNTSLRCCSLFEAVDGGTIKNLGVEAEIHSALVNYSTYAGALVGYNNKGTIINCHATVIIICTGNSSHFTSAFGGLVGANDGSIKNSYSTGYIINSQDTSHIGGLVGVNSGSIKNSYSTVGVSGSASYSSAGGLVGWDDASITNCYATGWVKVSGGTSNYVGGLVGVSSGGTIKNSYATGDLSTFDSSLKMGGLIGYGSANYINNSYYNKDADLQVRGRPYSGGQGYGTLTMLHLSETLKGMNSDAMKAASFVDTLNNNVIELEDPELNYWQLNTDNYPIFTNTLWTAPTKIEKAITIATTAPVRYAAIADGTSTKPTGTSGPVITWSADGGTSWGSASGSFAVGKVYKTKYVYTANTGYQFDSTIAQGDITVTNLGSGTKTIELTNSNKTLTITLTWPATAPSDWSDGITTTTATWDNGGTITTAQELAQFAYNVNNGKDYSGKTITLNNDIYLSGKHWIPIGTSAEHSFKGTFDGNGKIITGFIIGSPSVPDTTLSYVGLFGYVDGGTIKNIGVNAIIYSNKDNAAIGCLAGKAGIIINSYATGTVSGGAFSYVGGLTGYSDKVTNSYASVDVNGGTSSNVGGLVGCNNGTIEYGYFNIEAIQTVNGVSQNPKTGVGTGTSTGAIGCTSVNMKSAYFVTTLNSNVETVAEDATLHKWATKTNDYPVFTATHWIPPTKIEKAITIATTAPVRYAAIADGTSTKPTGTSGPVITWSADGGTSWGSASGSFAAGKVYKTKYVYTANTGYQFDSTIAQGDITVTNLGSGTKTIELTNSNKTLTITLTWPATETTDTTAPSLTAGAVNRTGETTATVKFTSTEGGTYYYNIGSAPDTSTGGTAFSSGETTISLTGLTASSTDIYIIAKDAAGNASLTTFKITIPAVVPADTTAPSLTAGEVSRTNDTTATVKFTSTEGGTYYYNIGSAPDTSTGGTAFSAGETTISLTNLTAGAKDIYIVAKDATGNTSLTTFKITIPAAIPATDYNIWVGGTRVTSANKEGVTGAGITGTVYYNPSTNTLTLQGTAITGFYTDKYSISGGIYASNGLSIVLIGSNTINITFPEQGGGVYSAEGNISLSGTGSLTISLGASTSYSAGIYANNDITINDCTVTAAGGQTTTIFNNNSAGISSLYGSLTITNATVIANGGLVDPDASSDGISVFGTLSVTNSTVTATGYRRALWVNSGNISASNSVVTASTDRTGLGATTTTVNAVKNSEAGFKYVNIVAAVPADTTAPSLTAGEVSRTSDTAATVKFTSTEGGTYYYNIGSAPDTSTGGTAFSAGETTITLTGLTAGAKDIYIVAKDAAGNTSLTTFIITIPAAVPAGTTAPSFTTSTATKTSATANTVSYSLSTAATTGTNYTVYSAESGSSLASGVTATLIGTTDIILTGVSGVTADTTYYISATESGKLESTRTAVIVKQYATTTTYSVSGSIKDKDDNSAVIGATVALTNTTDNTKTYIATTDINGDYIITGVPDGSYTVNVTKNGETYDNANTVITVSGSNVSGVSGNISVTIPTYTVTYDGNSSNGGTVPADSAFYKKEAYARVMGKGSLTRTGYDFTGWNTSSTGSGISYKVNDAFTIKENTTLYAQWKAVDSAQIPIFTVSNVRGTETVTQAAFANVLSVTAAVYDGGTLSYQWYERTDSTTAVAISSATNSSYTPPADVVGTTYYYVVVTNTKTIEGETKVVTNTSGIKTVIVLAEPATVYDVSSTSSGSLNNITLNNISATQYQNYTTNINPDPGYYLPDNITVTMGGRTLVDGVDYIYSKTSTGAGIVTVYNVTGQIAITAAGVLIPTKVYTISFNANGSDTAISTISGKYGDPIILPTPTKTGFIFAGWYRDSGFATSYVSTTMGKEDITLFAKWQPITYNISGNVKNEGNNNVNSASVRLMAGSREVAQTATDINGDFTISGIPAGYYNLVITKGDQTITLVITVLNSNLATGSVTLPTGKKNSVVEVKQHTPDIVVDKLNDFFNSDKFTHDDRNVVDAGGKVEIKLLVEKKDESGDNAAANADSIETSARGSGKTVGVFLNLTVSKSITPAGGATEQPTLIDQLSDLLIIDIPLPAELQGKSGYVIYRYHGAVVQTITEVVNADGEYIEVSSDRKSIKLHTKKFSTYAIGYQTPTPPVTPPTGGSSSGGSGGDSGSHESSSAQPSTIIAEPSKGGKITISDDKKTATITPDNEYVIADVMVDGKSIGATEKYTFTDSNNHKIGAAFIKKYALPYYKQDGEKVYIGFSALEGNIYKYIAPSDVKVEFMENPKSFIDNTIVWAKPSIDFVTEREIFVGTSQYEFSPNESMTRAMFVTVIGRLYEISYGSISGTSTFSDVNAKDYYAKYVAWANEKGIIKGIGGNKFAPNEKVTREQMSVIMFNFATMLKKADVKGDSLAYADSSSISAWAIDGAKYCQETKIITGRTGGKFAPKESATRAEVSAVIQRFIVNIMK